MIKMTKTTYYSKPKMYGGRLFIMVDDETRTFCKGDSNSCFSYYQPSQNEIEDLSQKALKQQAQALIKAGYKELSNQEYCKLVIK